MGSALAFDALLTALPFLALLLVALTFAVGFTNHAPQQEIAALFDRFLPRRHDGTDTFQVIKNLLASVALNRERISYIAIPTFIWFSTRLFASVRTALGRIYHSVLPPLPPQHFLLAFVRGKLHDARMVLVTLLLLLANVALTTALEIAGARGMAALPALSFFLSTIGRVLGAVLAVALAWSLFYVLYRFSTPRRPRPRSAAIGALFAAVAFELAKRLYGLYLQQAVTVQGLSAADNIGAIVLFVLWIYYTGVVLLLGATVAVILDTPSSPAP